MAAAAESPQPDVPFDEEVEQANGQQAAQRLRMFDAKMRNACWQKAEVVPGRHPERWREDAAGNIVCRKFTACQGCLCYEYDHIAPFSKGGTTDVSNCQILQTRVNRFKSDKEEVGREHLQHFSCNLKFTDREMDLVEMAVYGNVVRPGLQCRVKSVAEAMGVVTKKTKDTTLACEIPYKPQETQR